MKSGDGLEQPLSADEARRPPEAGFIGFGADDFAQVQDCLRAHDPAAELQMSPMGLFHGFQARHVRLGALTVSITEIGAPSGYELSFCPQDEYCVNIPLKGRGWIVAAGATQELDCLQALFVSPFCPVQKFWTTSSHVLTLHIPQAVLTEFMGEDGGVQLPQIAIIDRPSFAPCFDLLDIICKNASAPQNRMTRPLVAKYLENALLALLSEALPLNRSAQRQAASPAVPRYVRNIERYMKMNLCSNASLKQLALLASVSPRTLQYGFKTYHDMTPMHYFKHVRLSHAREALERGGMGSISKVANRVGYQNISHFSREFKAKFGVSPSAVTPQGGASRVAATLGMRGV